MNAVMKAVMKGAMKGIMKGVMKSGVMNRVLKGTEVGCWLVCSVMLGARKRRALWRIGGDQVLTTKNFSGLQLGSCGAAS